MTFTEHVEITGHLMDTGVLSRVLDDIREYGGDWVIEKIDVGRESSDMSTATIKVWTEDEDDLQRLLMRLQTRGVNMVDPGEAAVETARGRRGLPRRVLLHHQPRDPGPPRRPLGRRSRTLRWTAAWSSRSATTAAPASTRCRWQT